MTRRMRDWAMGLGFLAAVSSAHASGALSETWLAEGNPSAGQQQRWMQTDAPRALRLRVETQAPLGLTEVARSWRSRGFTPTLQVQATQWPSAAQEAQWRSLAELGAEFVAFGTNPPSDEIVQRLDRIAFSRVVWVAGAFPKGRNDLDALAKLHTPFAVTFATGRYPEFLEKFPIAALPLDTPLLFSVDYWPRYNQMDVLNLIPQRVRLRIEDTAFSDGSFPYLSNLKRLQELVIANTAEPSLTVWEKLRAFPMQWVSKDYVPSANGLAAFAKSEGASRKLTVDRDGKLSEVERARLLGSGLDIQWIHQAP